MKCPSIQLAIVVAFGISASSAPNAEASIYNVQSILASEPAPGLSGAISGSANYRS